MQGSLLHLEEQQPVYFIRHLRHLSIIMLHAGFEKTKADIVRVVHVGEATLAKRLSEFTHTSAGELTVDEFEVMDKRLAIQQDRSLDAMQPLALPVPDTDGSGCEHLSEPLPPSSTIGLGC